MKSKFSYLNGIMLLLVGIYSTQADPVYLPPLSSTESAKPIALIWIHGMRCKPEAYIGITETLQHVAAAQGYNVWVGIPEFLDDIPEPLTVEHHVQTTFNELRSKYLFPGNQTYLAAHSLGGVMSQMYAKGKSSFIKGLILMGAVLLRNTRQINTQGKTVFDFDVPTLTLSAELDGLMRISRAAEGYWHQSVNIQKSQQGNFPLIAMQGMSHSSFMDFSMLPSAVKSNDIQPEVSENMGYALASTVMVSFISSQEGNKSAWIPSEEFIQYTGEFMKPLLEAMELESSYNLKQPCYNHALVNDKRPGCFQGSPWTEHAQKVMGGNISRLNADITTMDNFHRVYTINPVHLPQINNSCPPAMKYQRMECMLQSITVTENYYHRLNVFDTGKFEVGAVEMKAKLMSRQSVQVAAGDKQADFHKTDEVGNRCGDINKEALQWALSKANQNAMERYNKYGKKLVIGDDLGPYNAGPLWIWHYLKYVDNADKTETTLNAPMMRTPTNYFIKSAAGFHYCKLLSPFRALEWIYIDSQYDHNGFKDHDIFWNKDIHHVVPS